MTGFLRVPLTLDTTGSLFDPTAPRTIEDLYGLRYGAFTVTRVGISRRYSSDMWSLRVELTDGQMVKTITPLVDHDEATGLPDPKSTSRLIIRMDAEFRLKLGPRSTEPGYTTPTPPDALGGV